MANLMGAIEYYDGSFWTELVDIGSLFYEHSDLYGALFGVTNYANFDPLFEGRGLPVDTSQTLRGKYDQIKSQTFGVTWALLSEIEAIDWNRTSRGPDTSPVNEYVSQDREGITMKDALEGTRFPFVMNLMKCIGSEFGHNNVRLIVYFD